MGEGSVHGWETKEGWVAKLFGIEYNYKARSQAAKRKKKAIGLNNNKNNFYYIRRYLTALGLRRRAVKSVRYLFSNGGSTH